MSGLLALGFGAPLALLGLLALPAIWWLVRHTPPRPTRIDFPPTALMRDLVTPDETPAKSPWWLLALRLGLAALLIAALAEPWWHPDGGGDDRDGPFWLVVDNGWPAAEGWPEIRDEAARLLARAEARARPVVLAATADGADQPLDATDAAAARARLAALAPRPWADDRTALLPALEAAAKRTAPGSLVWLAHGADLGPTEAATAFASSLVRLAGTAPVTLSRPARLDLLAIDGLDATAEALVARLVRADATAPAAGRLRALDAKGRALAEVPFAFAPGESRTRVAVALPTDLRNEVARLELADHAGAGAVHLVDAASRRRAVGLVSGAGFERDQPLLAPTHYLQAALAPFAEVRRAKSAETGGAVDELIAGNLSVLIVADVGAFPAATADRLKSWVEKGGTLVRFAGPHLTAPRRDVGDDSGAFTAGPRAPAGDPLLPIVPRAEARAFGGALSWETPRGLGPFAETGPFAGMAVPADVRVARQILAEPGPGLTDRTWASLDDGTPLVTAAPLGRGRLVFFHVGADTAWSNLPLGQTFVEMLRRIVALSATAGTGSTATTAATTLPPWRLLDGFGHLGPAGPDARPVAARDLDALRPSRAHPPGLWGTEGAVLALQTRHPGDTFAALSPGLADAVATALPQAPRLATVTRGSEHPTPLGPGLLLAALALALVDGLLALRPRRLFGRLGGSALVLGAVLLAAAPPTPSKAAEAATPTAAQPSEPPAAALVPRLAYVVTGNASLDDVSRRGLIGLGRALAARTAFEPAEPQGIDPATDDLSLYPLIYWPIAADTAPASARAMSLLDTFMKNGGTVIFDTRDADEAVPGRTTPAGRALRRLLDGLDLPALEPVPVDHVLGRTFYLLRAFPGRSDAGRLWVEATPEAGKGDPAERPARSGDGVSPILVTGNDFAGAWAVTDDGADLLPMIATAPEAREMALRVGVNIVMYVLTGNYKADQVHIPLILQRLGR